jgi:shikimate dehydrogenase
MSNVTGGAGKLPMLLGVMGDPIIHSKSPVMHDAALKACDLSGSYIALHVKAQKLEEAVRGVVALGFRGVNVTVPHKVDVMKYLDVVDEGARQIGAVNTIVNDNGVLTGYNTDGIGYIASLREEMSFEPAGKSILVVGSGGAARGIIYALLMHKPAKVIVANRTYEKTLEIAAEWSHLGNISGCDMESIGDYLSHVDLVINTTSVGMFPHVEEVPFSPQLLPAGIIVSDLIYNPLKTAFLHGAELRGCRIHNGLGMFLYQGAYAFKYWTGIAPPIDIMRTAVLQSMDQVLEK